MPFEHYIYSGTKRLRCGYTTGSCAAMAAQAATKMLFDKSIVDTATILTPKGLQVQADVIDATFGDGWSKCAIKKDGGDDVDATDQMLIYATVEFEGALAGKQDDLKGSKIEVIIDGGEGVGRVGMPGLDQPVGAAAINHVPRQMIEQEVLEICKSHGFLGKINVCISAPEGVKIAKKTFNPRLGIQGGISILGTSGIVEPQSLQALKDSITAEAKAYSTQSKRIVITPGSYGETFLHDFDMPKGVPELKFSNFLGHTLDQLAIDGFSEVLLVSHIGKLSKVAGGIMDTHSQTADCRCDIICAHAACAGASQDTCIEIMNCATTDACLDILENTGLLEQVLASISDAVQDRLEHRVAGAYKIGAVCFSNKRGLLFTTPQAQQIINGWRAM